MTTIPIPPTKATMLRTGGSESSLLFMTDLNRANVYILLLMSERKATHAEARDAKDN
jgi:hypothetical protein